MVGKVRTAIRETLTWWGDFLTKYGKVFAAILPFIVGGGGWFHFSSVETKDSDITMLENQITDMAKMMHSPVIHQPVIHQKTNNCGRCIKMVSDLRREFHGD